MFLTKDTHIHGDFYFNPKSTLIFKAWSEGCVHMDPPYSFHSHSLTIIDRRLNLFVGVVYRVMAKITLKNFPVTA